MTAGEPHSKFRCWNSWHCVAAAWRDRPSRPDALPSPPLPPLQCRHLAAASAACRRRNHFHAAGPHPRGLCHCHAQQHPASVHPHDQAASGPSWSDCGNGLKPPHRISQGLQPLNFAASQQHQAQPPQQRSAHLGADNWAVPGQLQQQALTNWQPPLQLRLPERQAW